MLYLGQVLSALRRVVQRSSFTFELINRRNVHVHNRGIVDDQYLGLRHDGRAQFNIYNLQLGSIASIDKDYFERAVRLCDGCVELVAAWAEALGQVVSTQAGE